MAVSFRGFEVSRLGDELTPLLRARRASPRLKDAEIPQEDVRRLYIEILVILRTIFMRCKLVHADFSEYNILYVGAFSFLPLPLLPHAFFAVAFYTSHSILTFPSSLRLRAPLSLPLPSAPSSPPAPPTLTQTATTTRTSTSSTSLNLSNKTTPPHSTSSAQTSRTPMISSLVGGSTRSD